MAPLGTRVTVAATPFGEVEIALLEARGMFGRPARERSRDDGHHHRRHRHDRDEVAAMMVGSSSLASSLAARGDASATSSRPRAGSADSCYDGSRVAELDLEMASLYDDIEVRSNDSSTACGAFKNLLAPARRRVRI